MRAVPTVVWRAEMISATDGTPLSWREAAPTMMAIRCFAGELPQRIMKQQF